MKLMFDLPAEDERILSEALSEGERRMYCLPFDMLNDRYVRGYIVITDRAIFKLLNGKLLKRWWICDLSDFDTENMYGSVAFIAKNKGNTEEICRFNSGKNLPRYSVIVTGCEQIARDASASPLASKEPERYCPKCGRPFLRHTQICPFCQEKKDIYKKLWGMTKGLRLMMLVPLFVTILSVILQSVVPVFQKIAINKYITNPDVKSIDGFMMHFVVIIIAIVTFDLLFRIIDAVKSRVSSVSGNKFIRMLRCLLFEKIQTLSMSSIQQKTTGDLMGRINNDVAVVQSFITDQLPNLFAQLAFLVVGFVVLLSMNWKICLMVFVPVPLAIFMISKFASNMHSYYVRSWLSGNRTNRFLNDTLNGIRVVKNYGGEDQAIANYDKYTEINAKQNEFNQKRHGTFFPIISFFVRIGTYCILLYGNYSLFHNSMTVGDLNLYNTYANMIYNPLGALTNIPNQLAQFTTSLSKILEILEEEPEVSDIDLPIDIRIEGDVEIRNVTFGYETYNPVLRDVSLSVKQGEMIGLVGHSGCGKSTLINLIMRLYDVTEGEIVIDDVNIKDISQNTLRSQIGVVLQETHLFYGSIRDNIRYSRPTASNEEVMQAAIAANAHDFIVNLPEGYNTIIGNSGYSLSGGERQRIAIARALINDPRILILDEATAALDTETEKLIQDAINQITKGRTTFVIAHRLSTLRNADKLLVLDHGRVAEFGTHTELLEKRGQYYKLVMAQKRAALKNSD